MSIDFSTLQGLTIPEGVVTQIADASGRVLWVLSGGKIVLEVEKITSDTYAGETTYTGEQFILLDIYPKTNGTVKVTYGGLTKTITDTSGAAEPNAQQVFFGTFNGVSDSVTTPASGELTIEGDCYAFGIGSYASSSKNTNLTNSCITGITDLGNITIIPPRAFYACNKITSVTIPQSVTSIGSDAFNNCAKLTSVTISNGVTTIGGSAFMYTSFTRITIPASVTSIEATAFGHCDELTDFTILATTPPTAVLSEFGTWHLFNSDYVPTITVPKGCGAAYKAATGWSDYADKIVEAS